MQLELAPIAAACRGQGRGPRVAAVYLPDLPLQRVLRSREAAGRAGAHRTPIAVEQDGRIVCCDAEARARGVVVGDRFIQAQAACPELDVVPMDEAADRVLLESVAEAMLAIAPTVEIYWPDTLLLDATGASLFASDGAET